VRASLGVVLLCAACASTEHQTLESALRSANPPRTIVLASSPPPRFEVTSVIPHPLNGLMGYAVELAQGERLIERHHIADPAPEVGRDLTVAFSLRHHLEMKPPRKIDSTRTVRKYFNADLVLDVATSSWTLEPSRGRLRLFYRARLELYDTRTGNTLVSEECEAPVLKQAVAPTSDELEANDGQIIKNELRYAANYCLHHFARRILRIWDDSTGRLYGETESVRREYATSTHEHPNRR
jgi:hypothetical protein